MKRFRSACSLHFLSHLSKVICCRLLNECILPYIYQKKPLYISIWPMPIWSLQSTDISNINIQYLILIYYLIFCETFVKYSIFHILYLIFDTLRISYLFIMKCLVLCILDIAFCTESSMTATLQYRTTLEQVKQRQQWILFWEIFWVKIPSIRTINCLKAYDTHYPQIRPDHVFNTSSSILRRLFASFMSPFSPLLHQFFMSYSSVVYCFFISCHKSTQFTAV